MPYLKLEYRRYYCDQEIVISTILETPYAPPRNMTAMYHGIHIHCQFAMLAHKGYRHSALPI